MKPRFSRQYQEQMNWELGKKRANIQSHFKTGVVEGKRIQSATDSVEFIVINLGRFVELKARTDTMVVCETNAYLLLSPLR